MLPEMTFREGIRLRDVLRIAFRSRTALSQVVFALGENLSTIAGDDDYVVVITNLIGWVEEQGRTSDLIASARTVNAGDPQLREFEIQYRNARPQAAGIPPLPQPVLNTEMRHGIVQAILRIPIAVNPDSRTVLLTGIPSSNLNRNFANPQADIEIIINQLDSLGRLSSGRRPLLLFIDNALGHTQDFPEVGTVLQTIRDQLAQAYDGE